MRRLATLVPGFALVLAACSSGANLFPLVASTPGTIGVGEQRLLLGIIDTDTSQYAASPDIEVVATLRDENGAPLQEETGTFLWTVPEVRGLYAVYFNIPAPGSYQVTLAAGELGELGPTGFVAVEDPRVIAPGEQAPKSVTRTLDEHDLSVITSDPEPDPAFYELSVSEAIEAGPTVVVFATPAWCQTQTCGPMLDQVKTVSGRYPEVSFVHVEIYEDIQVTSLDDLVPVAATEEWGLVSEPWVFVIGADGIVTASFEGTVSEAELVSAIDAVSP